MTSDPLAGRAWPRQRLRRSAALHKGTWRTRCDPRHSWDSARWRDDIPAPRPPSPTAAVPAWPGSCAVPRESRPTRGLFRSTSGRGHDSPSGIASTPPREAAWCKARPYPHRRKRSPDLFRLPSRTVPSRSSKLSASSFSRNKRGPAGRPGTLPTRHVVKSRGVPVPAWSPSRGSGSPRRGPPRTARRGRPADRTDSSLPKDGARETPGPASP